MNYKVNEETCANLPETEGERYMYVTVDSEECLSLFKALKLTLNSFQFAD